MKRRLACFVFAAAASMSAQVVPVGATGQGIIARFFAGIDCNTAQPTGFGTAALYFPFIAGIPKPYLFKAGATVFDETTAVLTAVFSKAALSQSTNFNITNTILAPNLVSYYYHPNTSPKDWTDFDGFQAGQLIAQYQVQQELFSTLNGVSWGIVSGPFTFSANFVLPDGSIANLKNFMPGGIAVSTMAALGTFVTNSNGSPQVVNLTQSTGPLNLGSCAVMIPFSGTGANPASGTNASQISNAFDRRGDNPEARASEGDKPEAGK